MIAYKKTAGRAHDIRFVEEDYVPASDEILIAGDVLPDPKDLSDAPTEDELRNEAVDGAYRAVPWTPRAQLELAWYLCLQRDVNDLAMENTKRVVRALVAQQSTYVPAIAVLADSTYANGPAVPVARFDLARVKDIKKNSGMVAVKAMLDAADAARHS